MINVTNDNFDSVVSSSDLTLVDFWADWCSPCRNMMPSVEKACSDAGITFAKAKVDDNDDKMLELAIRGIPALFLYRDGAVVGSHVGAMPIDGIRKFIESAK